MSAGGRILIVEARFYEAIADQLAAGACAVLDAAEILWDRLPVPGSFELPAAIRFALEAADPSSGAALYDGYVALGCVIRGETDHYDHVCRETSRALMDLAVGRRLALGFGLLTCETYEQARARAAVDGHNRGAHAARACLAMLALKRRWMIAD
jgi:6,7-dimethyl-8-ribityllumazine synthase